MNTKSDLGLLCWLALALFCGVRRCELKRPPCEQPVNNRAGHPQRCDQDQSAQGCSYSPISVRGMVDGGEIHQTNLRKRLEAVKRGLSF